MQNLHQLLSSPALQSIVRKAEYINSLNQSLQKLLDAEWTEHCRVADIKENCLILQVKNGAWATRLRFETPDLLKKLKTDKNFAHIKSIRWQVQKHTEESKVVVNRVNRPASENSKNALIASSQSIKNAKLKASMKRLASRLNY